MATEYYMVFYIDDRTCQKTIMVEYNSRIMGFMTFLDKSKYPESRDILRYLYNHLIGEYIEKDPILQWAVYSKEAWEKTVFSFFHRILIDEKKVLTLRIANRNKIIMEQYPADGNFVRNHPVLKRVYG